MCLHSIKKAEQMNSLSKAIMDAPAKHRVSCLVKKSCTITLSLFSKSSHRVKRWTVVSPVNEATLTRDLGRLCLAYMRVIDTPY